MSAFLLDLAAILGLAAAAGWCMRKICQPPVVGEIVVGVLLGPTLLAPDVVSRVMSRSVHAALGGLADLGVVLFMFAIGAGLDNGHRRIDRRTATISSCAMAVPLALGVGFALVSGSSAPSGANRAAFAVFMGVAMSVTAFPVLARILRERGMSTTPVGSESLTVAAVCDVAGWVLLALAAVLAAGRSAWQLALLPCYAMAMIFVVPRGLRLLIGGRARTGEQRAVQLPIVIVGLLLSAAATDAMSLSVVFGSFAFGLAIPRDSELRRWLASSLEPIAASVLLPVYFVLTGMSVDLTGFAWSDMGMLATVLAMACGGKLVGAYVGARLSGLAARDAATTAALLNTRGLTELIVLTVGHQLGLLEGRLYAVMVVMALVATAATAPLLTLIARWRRPAPPACSGPAAADPPGEAPAVPALLKSSRRMT